MSPLSFVSPSGRFRISAPVNSIFIFAVFLFTLTACGTVETISQEEIKTRYAKLTPSQALDSTSRRYEAATHEEFNYYSPQNWKLASEALNRAKDIAAKNENSQEIYKQVFLADRRIDSAKYIKDRVLKEFADLFESKKILQKNNAPSSFNLQYKENTSQLASLIRDFESFTLGTASDAENIRTININAMNLLKSMQVLNIKVVKHNYLDQGINSLKAMETQDAKSIAPVSFQQSVDALKSANDFIEKDVHNQRGVENVAEKFNFAVSHLQHVVKEINELAKMDKQKLEQIILTQENNLKQIGKALNGLDVRNLPLSMQAESVIKTANNVLDHHAEKSSMIVELTEKNMKLERQLSKRGNTDESANAKLKSKIKLLEIDLQDLKKEREKLKEDLFALQQKNIDLAIQNAKLLGDIENKQSNDQTSNISQNHRRLGANSRSFIKTSENTQ